MKVQFLKLAECLITDKKINSNELRVYAYLINLFNKEKGCSYPSIETIAKDINLSDRTVKNCIAKLVKLKYMSIEKKKSVKGNYNTYKDFKFIVSDKEQKKIAQKVGVDSNGNTPIDGQVTVEEALQASEAKEATLVDSIIESTGCTTEIAKSSIDYAKQQGAKNIKSYAIASINRGFTGTSESNQYNSYRGNYTSNNSKRFHNFEPRDRSKRNFYGNMTYEEIEAQLLGWYNDESEEVEEIQENTGYDFLKKYGIDSSISN